MRTPRCLTKARSHAKVIPLNCWETPAYRAGVEWTVEPGWAYRVEYAVAIGDWRPTRSVYYPEQSGTCAWVDDGPETGGQPKRFRFFRVVPRAP